jgi:hypothetical protein
MNANDPRYIAYLNARKPDGALAPPCASYALSLLRGADTLFAEEVKALSVALDTNGKGDLKSDLALDEEEVADMGFHHDRLTARVTLSNDDGLETIRDKLSDLGFKLADIDYDDEHSQGRPDHTSWKVDLNPRGSGGVFWLTVDENVSAPWGASRGVRAETLAKVRSQITREMATYAQNYVDGDFGPYYLSVEVLWDGNVVGDSSLGGVEVGYKARDKAVAEIIVENGMLDDALNRAAKWADTALERLPPRALRAFVAQPE